ncbi:hypothetical protein [Flammeovirga aprica]|uniref:Uncharacterized protein n=1 Tax=Flammeovirga aprica JL-4 TaxID=694437 RepID=A0A7X9RVV6_9BACT|nr:hypothetical protein [Flammeovirga aprica]NME69650.1 hypothetical protein [Flammeovirga aprica JL-4]
MNTLLLSFFFSLLSFNDTVNYLEYHQKVILIEEMIAEEAYHKALENYQKLYEEYDFVFKRDLKNGAALALYLKEKEIAKTLILQSCEAGWQWENFKKNKNIDSIFTNKEQSELKSLTELMCNKWKGDIDLTLRNKVHLLFKKDQKKALGAFIKIGDKAQDRYANAKFAPHSEKQLAELKQIITTKGYPGEQLIGNDFWGSTIISHHNSITYDYVKQDTLFEDLKPYLHESLVKGEISPYELALMEDWKNAVLRDSTTIAFGYLNSPTVKTIDQINKNRKAIGLRSVELRNKLVTIEEKTGMDFHLPDWVKGEIPIIND